MDKDKEYETGSMARDRDSGAENEWWKGRIGESRLNLKLQGLHTLEGDTTQQRLGCSHDFTTRMRVLKSNISR